MLKRSDTSSVTTLNSRIFEKRFIHMKTNVTEINICTVIVYFSHTRLYCMDGNVGLSVAVSAVVLTCIFMLTVTRHVKVWQC